MQLTHAVVDKRSMLVWFLGFLATNGQALAENAVVYEGEIKLQGSFDDVVRSPLPWMKNDDPLPTDWDWRLKGKLSADLNQHIPV